MAVTDAPDPLAPFSPAVREWFRTAFPEPTAAQAQGWPAIASGEHTLILAPTGSGKTLTAFLWSIDQLMSRPVPEKSRRLRTLYLSPLRALAVDVDKNLRSPLKGVQLAAERLGITVAEPTVGVRTGDTDPTERQRMARTPPDILITTPESLFLLLTSKARETLASIETVIIDEIHAMAATKRGSHLALSLERLEALCDTPPQRIGLSATQRPLEEIARFLGGFQPSSGGADRRPRPVTIVDAGVRKELVLEVVVPVDDLGDLSGTAPGDDTSLDAAPTQGSIWPAMHPRLLDVVLENHTTLVFVNARRLAERLAARLNELHVERVLRDRCRARPDDATIEEVEAVEAEPVPELVRAHHGSLSREKRLQIEDQLKRGELRGLVCTSSLELGIDMGTVDQVVQVASPGAVSRGLQRVGRAGHQVGQPSRGTFFPKFRGDLLETAVVVRRMQEGAIEATHYPRNPLDVLAQQVVAMAAMDTWSVDDLAEVVRRAAPFADLDDEVLHAVLDLLDGRYPSEEFSELRPRIVWDRLEGSLRGRKGAQRLAVTNPGTIPDRGLFGVFLPDGSRVGELDEEMVHESRVGETFLLGASTWRIEDIDYSRVTVTPAPGQPGKMPFWHGDGPGRPAELGRALGAFTREVRAAAAQDRDATVAELLADGLDARAASNVLLYLDEQQSAVGVVPDDRTIVVERFRDEIGDWRVCILSPWGTRVHAPWAIAIEHRLLERGIDPEILWADDGIVLRLQEAVSFGDGGDDLSIEDLLIDPDEAERLVVDQLASTALFTTVFREAAGRALLLPKRRPGERTALWQQRQRAANLLQVAARYPEFPITLEATREVLREHFDLDALRSLLTDLRSRKVRVREVQTELASPYAQSLLFAWVGTYLYDYDAPLAERRAAALTLDRNLLTALLGGDELRELLDPEVLADLELELQCLVDGRRARDADETHDLLRRLGPLTFDDVQARSDGDPRDRLATLVEQRRAIEVKVAGRACFAAAEDAGRLRDALGTAVPVGLPQAFTEPVDRPLQELVARYAQVHGPFGATDVARALGVHLERVEHALAALAAMDRVTSGAFRPHGAGTEWVDQDVLRRLRRRSLAALRAEVEPVSPEVFGRFLPAWHGVAPLPSRTPPAGMPAGRRATTGPRRATVDAVADVVQQLQGAPIPASVLEADVLPARLAGYTPNLLDELLATGEVVWAGAGSIGARDGRVVLCFRDQADVLLPAASVDPPGDPIHGALRDHLAGAGACFWPELQAATGIADQDEVLQALWDLVWSGEVTNDTLAPLRALGSAGRGAARSRRGRPRPGAVRRIGPPAAQGRWSLVAPLRAPATVDPQAGTRAAHALATQLLTRHGVATREGVLAEGVEGGFAAVYPVLKAMEEAGTTRRGWFVEGLGAAQFAMPGAVDRLRDERGDRLGDDHAEPRVVVLASTDPAQPYGAALPWPASAAGRAGRTAGSYVVLVDGHLACHLERGGRRLVTFDGAAGGDAWISGLAALVSDGRLRRISLTSIDGEDALSSSHAERLEGAGFVVEPRGLTLRG